MGESVGNHLKLCLYHSSVDGVTFERNWRSRRKSENFLYLVPILLVHRFRFSNSLEIGAVWTSSDLTLSQMKAREDGPPSRALPIGKSDQNSFAVISPADAR